MTFLNPFLLIGLAAAAIPIIIHLLNLRKLKVVEFSSLQFLKELQKTKMRRVKIRQILLLILRTLLILLLVFAFARPALKGSVGSIGSHAKSTMVIILDDSPSMSVRDERGVLFNQAIASVNNLLKLVNDGDELFFLRLSEIRHKDTYTPSPVSSVRSVLDKLTPSLETASFREALGVAAKVLAGSKNFNQEVHLITDAQATQFLVASLRDSSDLFDNNVKMFIVEIGKQQDNAGIASLDIRTKIISRNKPVIVRAEIRNFGSTPLHNSLTSVYVDGSRVVQRTLDIGRSSSSSVDFTITPKRRGLVQGYVQLEDDVFEADNKRYFALNIPESINILMIGGKPQDSKLASLALTLGGDSSLAGLFTTTQTTQAQLSSLDITKFDVLAFCGVKEFTNTEADRVAAFVKAGGGVLMFPDDETVIPNLNATVFDKLGIPPSQPAQGEISPTEQTSFLSFDKIDYDHPLFEGLFEQPASGKKQTVSVESPRVYRAIKPQAGEKGHTIIRLTDGSEFLTEYTLAAGRVLLFSVEPNILWSDFPVKGLFAPLLHRSIMYLAGGNSNVSSSLVGENIKASVRIKGSPGKGSYICRSPNGIEERIAAHATNGSGTSLFESSPITETGVYELLGGSTILHASAVNIDPVESDLRHASEEEMGLFWHYIGVKKNQVRRLQASEKLEATILESRLGVELWKYCLSLAIMIALIEMMIARESRSAAAGKAKA